MLIIKKNKLKTWSQFSINGGGPKCAIATRKQKFAVQSAFILIQKRIKGTLFKEREKLPENKGSIL